MRFQPRSTSRLGTRRDQRRLVMMVGMLVLVFWGMFKSAQPKTWEWLTGPQQTAKAPTAKQLAAVEALQREAASRALQADELPEGAFRSPAVAEAPEKSPVSNTADEVQPGIRAATAIADRKSVPQSTDQINLVIPKNLLSQIQDDVLYLHQADLPAYWEMLGRLQSARQDDLEALSQKDLTYVQLFSDPDFYRGQLVTLDGELLQLQPLNLDAEHPQFPTRFEGWFRNADSGKNPYVFHALEKPTGLNAGDRLSEKVRITGYLFKRYNYAAKSGTSHAAPLFLVKRIRWFPRLQKPEPTPAGIGWLLGGLATTGVLISGMLWWFMAQSHHRAGARMKKFLAPDVTLSQAALSDVPEVPLVPVFPDPDEVES